MRTAGRDHRLINQPGQALGRVTAQPPMHTLTRHTRTRRHLQDRHALIQDLEHSLITLLHHTQLHQHDADPLRLTTVTSSAKKAQLPQARTPNV
jgi:hypothetical protein